MTINRDLADSARVPPFNKNFIINVDMSVNQRGNVTAALNDYTLDRWFVGGIAAALMNVSQGTPGWANGPFEHSLILDVTLADASVGAGDVVHITQKIEGNNSSALGFVTSNAKDITVSFWHAHTKTGTNYVAIRSDTSSRSYVAAYTQSVADTWEQSTITIPGCTDGTWGTDEGWGVALTFTLMAGTNFNTTADAWQTGAYYSTSSQVNNLDSASNFFRIANVQLEAGDVSTDFEYRSFSEELAMCKRYYQKSFKIADTPADNVDTRQYNGMAVSTTQIRVFIDYEVEMRSFPSLTLYQPSAGSSAGKWAYWNAAWINSSNTTLVLNLQKEFAVDLTVTGRTLGDAFMSAGGWTADAEL